MIKGMDILTLSPAYKFHFEHKLRFDEICDEIKRQIGLARVKDEIVEKVMEQFDATQI
jgi:hypothetical protein